MRADRRSDARTSPPDEGPGWGGDDHALPAVPLVGSSAPGGGGENGAVREIRFTVPGRPVPAARMTRRGKWKPNAQRYLAFKDQVGWCARAACPDPIRGPVAVEIRAWWSGGRHGDADNIAKAVLDGCNGILWADDRQVVELHVYLHTGTPQRTEVWMWNLNLGGAVRNLDRADGRGGTNGGCRGLASKSGNC